MPQRRFRAAGRGTETSRAEAWNRGKSSIAWGSHLPDAPGARGSFDPGLVFARGSTCTLDGVRQQAGRNVVGGARWWEDARRRAA